MTYVIYREQEIQNLNVHFCAKTLLLSITEILTPISTDHFPVLFSLSKEEVVSEVKNFGNLAAPKL